MKRKLHLLLIVMVIHVDVNATDKPPLSDDFKRAVQFSLAVFVADPVISGKVFQNETMMEQLLENYEENNHRLNPDFLIDLVKEYFNTPDSSEDNSVGIGSDDNNGTSSATTARYKFRSPFNKFGKRIRNRVRNRHRHPTNGTGSNVNDTNTRNLSMKGKKYIIPDPAQDEETKRQQMRERDFTIGLLICLILICCHVLIYFLYKEMKAVRDAARAEIASAASQPNATPPAPTAGPSTSSQ